jgi:hypothetical protein
MYYQKLIMSFTFRTHYPAYFSLALNMKSKNKITNTRTDKVNFAFIITNKSRSFFS